MENGGRETVAGLGKWPLFSILNSPFSIQRPSPQLRPALPGPEIGKELVPPPAKLEVGTCSRFCFRRNDEGAGKLLPYVLVLAATLFAVAPAGAILALSTSFEEQDPAAPQPRGWGPVVEWLAAARGGEAVWAEDDSRTGSRSVRLRTAGGSVGYQAEAVPCSPDEVQVLAAWVKTDEGTHGARVALRWVDQDRRPLFISASAGISAPGRWHRAEIRVVPPPEARWAVPICVLDGPGRAWFDDVHLNAYPAPKVEIVGIETPASIEIGGVLSMHVTVQPQEPVKGAGRWVVELYPPEGQRAAVRHEVPCRPAPGQWTPGVSQVLQPLEMRLPEYMAPGQYILRLSLEGAALAGMPPRSVEVLRREPIGANPPPAVHLALDAAAQARAGEELSVSVSALSESDIAQALRGFVSLTRNGSVWAEESYILPATRRTASAATISIRLPRGLESGEYALVAGRYDAPQNEERPTAAVAVQSDASALPAHTLSAGSFADWSACVHRWQVRRNGVLLWDGDPYIPVGGAVSPRFLTEFSPGDEEGNAARWQEFVRRSQLLYEAGVRDIYITADGDLTACRPEALLRLIDRLEELRFTYGLDIGGSVGDGFLGYWVTDRFNLRDIPGGQECQITLDCVPPEHSQAIVVSYDQTAKQYFAPKILPISPVSLPNGGVAGLLVFDLRGAPADHLFRIFVVPQQWVPAGVGVGDIWTDLDQRRREIAEFFRYLRLGPGFRFWMDPLGPDLRCAPADVIPSGQSLFSLAFSHWLSQRYSLAELAQAWGIGGDLPSFGVAGRLVPVMVEDKKLLLVDPDVGYSYLADRQRSSFLWDLAAFREQSISQAVAAISADLKARVAGVPVVLTHRWEVRSYYLAADESGHDGVGAEAFGPPSQLPLFNAVAATAEAMASPRALWPIAIRTAPELLPLAGKAGYGDPNSLSASLSALARAGARGFFYAAVSAESPSPLAIYDLCSQSQELEWLAAWKRTRSADVATMDMPSLVPMVTPLGSNVEPREKAASPWLMDGSFAGSPVASLADGRWLVPSPGIIPRGFPQVLWRLPSPGGSPGRGLWSLQTLRALAACLDEPPSGLVIVPGETPCGIPELDAFRGDEGFRLPDGRSAISLRPPPGAEILGEADGKVWHFRRGKIEVVGLPEATPIEILEVVSGE